MVEGLEESKERIAKLNGKEMQKEVERVKRLYEAGRLSIELTNHIITGKVRIRRLPKLQALFKMNHKKVLNVLRQCPESPHFN